MILLLVWAFALVAALVGSVYSTFERRSLRDTAGALWITAVGALLGAGLMGDYLVMSFARDPARYKPSSPYGIFFIMAAFIGVLLGPMGFIEGLRYAHPLKVPAHVNVTRGLYLVAWALSSLVTVATVIYV
jgi:drug/metabolite transporter (DMT)-like permease